MSWTIDIQGPKGQDLGITAKPFHGARITWTADGPGAFEIDLKSEHLSDDWQPGTHRAIFNLDGTPKFAGSIITFEESGTPTLDGNGDEFKASGVGLKALLDKRIVRFGYRIRDTLDNIVASLLDEAQVVQINGDMGLSMGVTNGAFETRTRNYCRGPIIAEEIDELASTGKGFDWEVDATGALNMWGEQRGNQTGLTLEKYGDGVQSWAVEADTAELLTNVTALGDKNDPWGPASVMARFDDLTATYGRHEVAINVNTNDENELLDAAKAEMRGRRGALTRVTAGWFEGRGPWAFGDVEIGDKVTIDPGSIFGGSENYRCIEITVTLDGNEIVDVEHVFERTVNWEDISDGDSDEGESS